MNTTSLTTTGTAAFGAADLAGIIQWGLMGFPKDQVASVSVGLACLLIVGVHALQKVIASRLTAPVAPVAAPVQPAA